MWGDLRRGRAGALAVGALLLVGGCGGSASQGAPLPPKASASVAGPTPAASISETDQILAQYRAFWKALPKASAAPASQRRAILEDYVARNLLNTTLDNLRSEDKMGRRLYGAEITRPRLVGEPTTVASIKDCLDSSHTGLEDYSDHPLTVGRNRNSVDAKMTWEDNKWKISDLIYNERSC